MIEMDRHLGTGTTDVVVVGGGLAGLATAALLARAGCRVMLYEAATTIGGRARTQEYDEFQFNLGPHALYLGGPAEAVLDALGVVRSGHAPRLRGYALDGGTRHRFPGGMGSLLTTSLFDGRAKLEVASFLGRLPRMEAAGWHDQPVAAWLDQVAHWPSTRRFLQALIRVTSYVADTEQFSAGAAIEQLRAGIIRGVRYLDGGWQTLVDGLRVAAEQAGAQIIPGTRVVALRSSEHDSGVHEVQLGNGATQSANAIVLATRPANAAALVASLGGTAGTTWAEATPVAMACLDLGLTSLPNPRATYALGIDRPTYYSVHSAAAHLAPATGATIHVGKYLAHTTPHDPAGDEQELEAVMDLVQPGWRDLVVTRRFLPRMIVSNAMVTAAGGGLGGRPGPAVPNIAGLYIVGDWVGGTGWLADASLASAHEAARLILADRDASTPTAGTLQGAVA